MTKQEVHELEMANPVFRIKTSIAVDGHKEYYIEANSGGLYLFAEEISRIADDAEQDLFLEREAISAEVWNASQIVLDRVEIIRTIEPKDLNKKGWHPIASISTAAGCGILVVALLSSLLVGAWVICSWIFG